MFRRDSSTTDRTTGDSPSQPASPVTPPPAPVREVPAHVAPPPVAQAPAAPAAAGGKAKGNESLVAAGDTFEGKLSTNSGVKIMGTVRGTIESSDYVHIEENAQVESDITAAEVVIGGRYIGSLVGRKRVEIRATGHVSGKIETEKLLLHEGGFFDGELHMQKTVAGAAGGQKPAPPAAHGDANSDTFRRSKPPEPSTDGGSGRERSVQ